MGNAQPAGWADIMVQNQINLLLDGPDNVNAVVRTDRVLSQMNHQLFRQSRNYCVKLDLDPSENLTVDVYALVDTWWLQKAYAFAKKTYDKNLEEEMSQAGTTKARWLDFRVDHGLGLAFQTDMVAGGATTPGTWQAYTANQEYIMSEVHDAASTQRTFAFLGAGSATEYNIIDEYDLTANTDRTPATTLSNVAYDGLDDAIDDGAFTHVKSDGNDPPYNKDDLENGVLVRIATLTASPTGPQGYTKLSTGYFNAPAGLIVLQSSSNMTNDYPQLTLTVKEGKYKGVHAPSMLE
jgi:hypothetical protein